MDPRAAYPRVASTDTKRRSIVEVAGVPFGDGGFVVAAGPCAIESHAQLEACARTARTQGAALLRGGAFKPRTSPYSFEGLKLEALPLLAAAKRSHGLPVVTEVIDVAGIPAVAATADMLQIGARNMQNYALLDALGAISLPVLVKRAPGATLEEWLLAAERIAARGNERVVLCERGIRTFEQSSRFTLDLGSLPVLRELTHLPIVVDPSHGTGRASSVIPMARAAFAAGADGVFVEIHPAPAEARCDGAQALTLEAFGDLMSQLRALAPALGRHLVAAP